MTSKLKRCPEKGHTYCYNKCRKCGHCDTSYEENPNLLCKCQYCDCRTIAIIAIAEIHNPRKVAKPNV